MIVDDDIVSRTKLKMILSEIGTCHDFPDGKSAEESFGQALIEKQPYHLVCLDLLMPEKDGFDVLMDLKQLDEDYNNEHASTSITQYIMVTSVNERGAYDAAMDEECIGYIVKPYRRDLVLEKLKLSGLY